MASSGSSPDDFQSRVEKIFGSLAFSRSPSSSSSSGSPSAAAMWSLPDGDVEKREWTRDQSASYDRGETPCASSFDELLKQQRSSKNVRKQFEDDADANDGHGDGPVRGEDDEFGDEWSIRSSIGLDRTLDNEEEEDDYDKMALGRENTEERLYMKDLTDQGSSLGSRDRLAKSSDKITRDPRANHVAAKLRLKEDEAEAKKFSSSHKHGSGMGESHGESPEEVTAPKPILKRKDTSSETRSSKRVRFDLGSGSGVEETTETTEDISTSPCSVDNSESEGVSHLGETRNQIPDYLMNPSRYTCYSFDSSGNENEKSTTEEYMDTPKFDEGGKSSEPELSESRSGDDMKKVTFIPRRKRNDVREENMQETEDQGMPTMGIAVGEEAVDGGLDETEDEDRGTGETERTRQVRQYRARKSSD
ncbi:PREDICTED: uncharacterized protein LOC104825464 [Tarenaya hassleriana]|uniref:uncharacterized protein LOC104825464 n=1 Tax=Tarenaya hassleriana TaxID=28532 RepID=UPI00053C6368|nr:PREDICTED: uncharacterized protein LOC104825464 [Tarenaya hassleriana]